MTGATVVTTIGKCFFAALVANAVCSGQVRWRGVSAPGEALAHAMAYDEVRGEIVVFGGFGLGPGEGTWIWDGCAWSHRPTTAAPSIRLGTAMAFDRARGVSVLFGGRGYFGLLDETWEWNGTTWTLRAPSTRPPVMQDHVMAFDATLGEVLAVGGMPQETWSFDGARWMLRADANGTPQLAMPAALAWDEARRRGVMVGYPPGPLALMETWEWDSAAWVQRSAGALPLIGVTAAGLCYGGAGRVVLFGGWLPVIAGTWEWDGTQWTQHTPGQSPSNRSGHKMVYDFRRSRVVLVGGDGINPSSAPAETWEWDGVDWLRVGVAPSGRSAAGLAYHEATDRSILFGGGHYNPVYQDTWAHDGNRWLRLSPTTQPAPRFGMALCAEPGGGLLLFGGGNRTSVMGDTWVWNGVTWVAAAAAGPSPRSFPAAALDKARGRVVLFGGSNGGSLGDTWEWDGSNWIARAVAGPPPRTLHAMAYDAARGRTVLFGGGVGASRLNDTWEWDGFAWTEILPPVRPPARARTVLTYDAARGVVVLFGGYGKDPQTRTVKPLDDLWEWDGARWQLVPVSQRPPPRESAAITYDSVRQRAVLFGGHTGALVAVPLSGIMRADTWLLEPVAPTAAATRSQGCSGGAGSPWLCPRGIPSLGNRGFGLSLRNAAGASPCVFLLSPAPATLPLGGGCSLLVGTPAVALRWMTAVDGTAHLPLPIPPNPALVGGTVSAQAAIVDPAGPWLGLAFSPAVDLVVGS